MKKERQKTVFMGCEFIISIKNNTFILFCLGNGILFITFASLKPILL